MGRDGDVGKGRNLELLGGNVKSCTELQKGGCNCFAQLPTVFPTKNTVDNSATTTKSKNTKCL